MIYQFLIVFFIAPNLLHQVLAASMKQESVGAKAVTNSSSTTPKETSYFYRDPQGPGTYEFGYHIEDNATGNIQFREETRHANGTITGSYGYLRPDGKMTVTRYIADEKGYRKKTTINRHPLSSTTLSPSPSPSPAATVTTEIPGLNLNSGTLPPQLVADVMDKFQIDLSPDANPSDILHPNISDIINGLVPLKTDKDSSQLGFEVVHDFIPTNFPFAPFQLPTEQPNRPIID